MNKTNSAGPTARGESGGLLLLAVCLAAILGFLFLDSFDPGKVLFCNDAPLGIQSARCFDPWEGFTGIWYDLYWLGTYGGSLPANFSRAYWLLDGPRALLSFYVALSAFVLGLCAWFFFRRLGFGAMACVLGGLAAALNMNFFSAGCWGLASRGLCLAAIFLALSCLESGLRSRSWIKTILAGLAIGMAISEAGDNGAIFSLFVAAYAVFLSVRAEGPLPLKLAKGLGQAVVMAVFAAILAAQSLEAFRSLAVKNVAGVEDDTMSKEAKWDWATQWSLPKAETLRVIIPGIYGYRLDTRGGGNYWGRVGQQPGWEKHRQGFPRHSGSGEYAGVLVVLVALWALCNSFSRSANAFSPPERQAIWFWGAMALVALGLSWGRYAPFYQFIYALPYFSTIRNPMKFMHPFHMTLMILFAYGVQGLVRLYLGRAAGQAMSLKEHLRAWWSTARPFEKKWNYGCAAGLAVSVLGFLMYNASQAKLAEYMSTVGFEPELARMMARFSAHEVGLFVIFLAAAMALLLCIQSGAFAGTRARWAGLLLGAVLVIDLVRADLPWIKYEVIAEKYATNPVLDLLRQRPYEYRVSTPNFQVPPQVAQWHALLQQVYHVEWLQHHFMYYNIQALEVAQMPRVPQDFAAYNKALAGSSLRMWQLTNTRYIMALAGFTDAFNAQLDPQKKRFRTAIQFDITQRPGGGITAVPTTNGPFALIEFTGALPRAKLYTRWEVSTNDQATLQRLADPAFDPEQAVVVSDPVAPPPTNAPAGELFLERVSYEPKRIRCRTRAEAPTVLLLNDRWNADWNVLVDGRPARLLRCNYVMRGVQLEPGPHTVEFYFRPKLETFYVSLSATGLGLVLCLWVVVGERRDQRKGLASPARPTA